MRLAILSTAAAVTLFAAVSASAATRQLMVTDFDRIMVEGPYAVTVSKSRATAASASGSAAALDGLDVSVIGKTLRIRPKRAGWGERGKEVHQAATIAVTSPNLRFAALTGSGSLTINGIGGLKADLSVNGTGQLSVAQVKADRVALAVRGAATATLSGTAGTIVADVSGSSNLDASALAAQDVQITAQTSGMSLAAAARTAKIVSTGAGDVTISGKAACEVNNIGTGSVRCGPATVNR